VRVVNRKTFLALPAGTIYCKGAPWAFQGLCIKGDSLPSNDWIYLDMAWASAKDSGEASDILENSLATGSSFACEDDYGRDGCFNEDAIFLVFERADLTKLRSYIDGAMEVS
jgi:hypothetical protein